MGREQPDCEQFRTALSAWLEGSVGTDLATQLGAHSRACRVCASELAVARGVDQLLRSWHVPSPPKGFADRFMQRLRTPPSALPMSCEQFAAAIEAYLDGTLDHGSSAVAGEAAAVEQHAAQCDACAEHLRQGQEAERLFQHWTVPVPPAAFTERIMQRLQRERTPRRTRRWRTGIAILLPIAAAALLLVALNRSQPAHQTDGFRHGPGGDEGPVVQRTLDLKSSGTLWPLDTHNLGADPLTDRRTPLGQTFRRSLERVSHQPGR